jgi:hypothetical protein
MRGNLDKPVLMVDTNSAGFGLVQAAAIDPHLTLQKRENDW